MFGVNGGEDLFLPEGFSDLQRGVSLFFVVNIQDTTGVDVLLSMLPNGPMLDLVSDAAMDLLSVDYHVGAGSTTGGRAYAFPYHNWHLVELVQQSGSVGGTSTFTAYLDGTVLVTASQNVPGREVKTPKLGPTLQQGYMFMQAALIYSEPVSNDERRQIERYLMSKWKIPP